MAEKRRRGPVQKKVRTNIHTRTYRKSKLSLSDPIVLLGLFVIIGGIISAKLMGIEFALLLIGGVFLILILSKLINIITKNGKRKVLSNILVILFLIVAITITVVAGGFFAYVVSKAPEFDVEKLTYAESTLVYDSKGTLIAELGAKKRENINYDQMSEVLVDAIIATEDSRFFQHNGFDAARFLKASIGQAVGNSGAGGASTLSMQVIKNSFTSSEASGMEGIIRKFTDIYLSVFKLEKNYTKQEIIEFYANNHFLGANSYGVEQAAKTYFGKEAKDLNLAEASLIVGLFKAPTNYNPYNNPEAATARRKTVLNLMYTHGYITKEEMELADSIPVSSLLVGMDNEELEFQGYIDTVTKEIEDRYKVNPYNTPMMIYTNMDINKQRKLNAVFSGESFKWENSYVQAGVAAIDVKTGKIIAIGNGRNRKGIGTYNFATDINRQIGSTAKPIFDYAPGMEFLNWSTYTIFNDSPHTYSGGQPIRNSDRGYMGNMTLRQALAQSRNVPALKAFQAVMKEIGSKKYKSFVESFGMTPESNFHEAHAIGSFNGSNPLDMAAGYAVFANGGYYYEPYSVNKIIYRSTGEVIEYESEGKRIISDSTAFMITDVLITAVQSGLSGSAKIDGYQIAAKTGTTNYDSAAVKKLGVPNSAVPDAWIIGYTGDTSIGMWYGCETVDKNHYLSSSSAATQRKRLFQAIGKILFDKSSKFETPDSVVKVAVEKGSNPARLASSSTPSNKIVYEYFKKGTEPTEVSYKYSTLNKVSGLTGTYDASSLTMKLKWNATSSKAEDEDTYGDLGYKIYKDDKYIAFTTDTSYNILNVTNPSGTYKVITSYKNYSDNASEAATYTYKTNDSDGGSGGNHSGGEPSGGGGESQTKIYNSELKHTSANYSVGDNLPSYDRSPSANDVIVTLNGNNVTSSAEIDVTIVDSSGSGVSSIDSSKAETYRITYVINCDTYTKTLRRTITIQ